MYFLSRNVASIIRKNFIMVKKYIAIMLLVDFFILSFNMKHFYIKNYLYLSLYTLNMII